MAASDAPTKAIGGNNGILGGWGFPIDDLEHIPDMAWPASVQILAKMRTDPTLQSVLAAYITPLLAARWEIDPRGAHPEAVRICADSLGLPVAGEQHDDIGAARRRGVKWTEHVRLAALHLVWGHFGFEPVYEIRGDGRAYLLALPERMPNTIVDISVDRAGALKSITQSGQGDKASSFEQEIPADRLLWYVHDREGSVWQGRSLLRACYSHWLLKLDTLRTNAIGIARFGAGTPVAEPLPGTNPTEAQVREAQQLVSAIRVGQTGGAVPVGFKLRIVGVEGTLPDAMPTLRYYDEQMARAALTSLLDLGSTANGSRALGGEFADVMKRALQSIADRMAETASQLCVRLTTYNFGPDAVPPVITCGDVGASKATIAQSITSLMQAGAITPDPSLEAYTRDAYNLPPATAAPAPGKPDPMLCGAPLPKGGTCKRPAGWGTDHPGEGPCIDHDGSKAAKTTAKAAPAKQQPAQREPTDLEVQAGVDPEQIDADQAALEAAGVTALLAILTAWGVALTPAIAAAMTAGDLVALAKLAVPDTAVQDAAETLAVLAREAWDKGVAQVIAEAAHQGVTLTAGDVIGDPATLDPFAQAQAELLAIDYARAAGVWGVNLGVVPDTDGATLAGEQGAAEVVDHATGQTTPDSTVRAVVARGMGGGRHAAMDSPVFASIGVQWFATAIRDRNTCGPCRDNDQHVYPDLETGFADFQRGHYFACLGGDRCRCILAIRVVDVP